MTAPGPNLRLVTLNLWNVNEPLEQRMADAAAWFAEQHPDIAVFQEVGQVDGRYQVDVVAATYRNRHFDRAVGEAASEQGLAVATDLPLTPFEPVVLPEVEGDHRRIMQQVEVETSTGPLRIANTHLAWRLEHAAGRVRQAAAMAHAFDGHEGPVVLAGDINDVHGSSALQELCDRGGFADVCADDRPTFAAENPWTWQVSLFDRRIDHVLVRGAVTTRDAAVVLTGEDAPPVSDHYAVSCRLTLNG